MCPREESNLNFEFRKLMSYPLNDGDERIKYASLLYTHAVVFTSPVVDFGKA